MITSLSEAFARWSLYRGKARLLRSALLGDPVSQILAMPRGRSGYHLYDKLRARGDLVRGRSGIYMSATYKVCNEVLRGDAFGAVPIPASKRNLTATRDDVALVVHPLDDSFASMDPPEHTRLRKIVAPYFSPPAIRRLESLVERVVEDELDRLDRPGSVDLIDEFGVRVPSRVICEILGLPEKDHDTFVRWGLEFGAIVDGARTPGELRRTQVLLTEMAGYFSDLCELRAREPGDDVVSAMIRATEAGEMTYPGLIATCEALLIGGFVTTSNIIGNAVVGLTAYPEQREALLAEPELVSQLVEEVLRLEAPAQYSVRITREPVTLAGQRLDKGVPIVTLLAGANRDPAVFEQPHVLNIRRRNAKEHLSFAAGIHYCIGAGLARLEERIALAGLFRRYPHLRIDGPVRYCPSRVIRGPMKLPVSAR